jgi:hypothetical protein
MLIANPSASRHSADIGKRDVTELVADTTLLCTKIGVPIPYVEASRRLH